MVNQGRGRLFRRKDNKYLIYLPKDLCEDSAFPFKDLMEPSKRKGRGEGTLSLKVDVSFSVTKIAPKCLIITPAKQ
jgi:hypothetical protein